MVNIQVSNVPFLHLTYMCIKYFLTVQVSNAFPQTPTQYPDAGCASPCFLPCQRAHCLGLHSHSPSEPRMFPCPGPGKRLLTCSTVSTLSPCHSLSPWNNREPRTPYRSAHFPSWAKHSLSLLAEVREALEMHNKLDWKHILVSCWSFLLFAVPLHDHWKNGHCKLSNWIQRDNVQHQPHFKSRVPRWNYSWHWIKSTGKTGEESKHWQYLGHCSKAVLHQNGLRGHIL